MILVRAEGPGGGRGGAGGVAASTPAASPPRRLHTIAPSRRRIVRSRRILSSISRILAPARTYIVAAPADVISRDPSQRRDLPQGESQALRPLDEPHPLDGLRGIGAVSRRAPGRSGDQPTALVVPQRLAVHPCPPGDFADLQCHVFHRESLCHPPPCTVVRSQPRTARPARREAREATHCRGAGPAMTGVGDFREGRQRLLDEQ